MAFRSSTSASGNSTTATGLAPAGLQPGDRLFASLDIDTATPTVTPPAGWSLLGEISNAAPDGHNLKLYEIRSATGSESYAFTLAAASDWIIQIAAFSGRGASQPAIVQPSSSTASNATPITLGLAGVTALANSDLLLVAALDQTVATDTWGFSQVTGFTERQDVSTGAWSTLGLQTQDNVAGGATGTLNSTATRATGTGNAGWLGFVVAIPVPVAIAPASYQRFRNQGGASGGGLARFARFARFGQLKRFDASVSSAVVRAELFSAPAGGNNIADSVTETAAANHSQSALLSAAATIGETLVSNDSPAATLSASSVVAEAAIAADTQAASVSTSATVAETAAAADSQSATVTTAATLAETAAASDSQTATTAGQTASLSETATTSDSQSATVTALTSIAESAAATDSVAATLSATGAVAEPAAAAHSQTAVLAATATLDEILAAADSAAAALVATASVTEMVSTDGLSLSGAMNAYGWFSGDLVPGGLYDPFLSLALAGQNATSGFAANLAGTATVAEIVASSDSLTADAGTVTADLNETATAADSQNGALSAAASLSETAVLTSTPAATLTAAAALNETVAAADNQSVIQETTATIAETVISSHSQTDITGTVAANLNETATVNDSLSVTQAATAAMTESVVVDHNQNAAAATAVNVNESASVNDSQSAGTALFATLAEITSAADLQSSLVLIQDAIAESAIALESALADVVHAATVIENATPLDVVSATGGQDYPAMPWTRYYDLVAKNRKQNLIAFNKAYQITVSATRYDIRVFL